MSRCAAATRGRSAGAVRLQVGGETRGDRFGFDLGEASVALGLRRPHLLTQAHPQVGDVGEVKIHVERVGSPGVIVGEEMIHSKCAVSVWLLLAVGRRWKGKRLRGEIPVHLTFCLFIQKEKDKNTDKKKQISF